MNPEWMAVLQEAAGHFQRGQYGETASLCRQILRRDPAATDARHLLAMSLRQTGRFDEAEREFRACLRAQPRRADIHANLANLLVASGQISQSIAEYGEALACEPAFRPARLGLARAWLRLGEREPAAREARALLERNRGDAEAWNILGSAEQQAGHPAHAERAFRQALAINPNYAVARHNLGALYAQLSRSEAALAELDAAAAAGIRGPEIDRNRASALMALLRLDEAEQILDRTVSSYPADVQAHTLLARIRFMRGSAAFADTFASAVAAIPDNVDLCLGYSRVLRGARRFDDAQNHIEYALRSSPGQGRYRAELAAIHQDAGRFALALEHARAARSAMGDDPGIDDILIDALTCLGEARQAKPLVEAARRRDPLNQWYVAMQATIARLLGDPLYEVLYDYEAFVRPYELPVPKGWPTIEAFHRDLIPALTERHPFRAEPLDQSLRHGTQTPRGLLGDPDPVIQAFLQAIREPIARYREAIGFDAGHPLRARNSGESRLIGCWSVRLHRDGFHVNHVHSEGWISSAYYVEVPAEVADSERKSGWIKFGEPRFEVPGATPEKFVQPAAGRLVLFPSYLWHGTNPIHGDEPRMTIAFDVVADSPKA